MTWRNSPRWVLRCVAHPRSQMIVHLLSCPKVELLIWHLRDEPAFDHDQFQRQTSCVTEVMSIPCISRPTQTSIHSAPMINTGMDLDTLRKMLHPGPQKVKGQMRLTSLPRR